MHLDQEDKKFLQRCQTSVLIPTNDESTLDEILSEATEFTPRTNLYFDENLRVLILLDIPTCSEEKLHAYISNTELRVDAWASALPNGDGKSPTDGSPTRDLIASVNVAKVDDPFTLVRENEGEVILSLVWEVRIDLTRPRIRALQQTVTFLPIANVRGTTEDKVDDGDFLEPFTTLEFNVLDPLRDLPGLQEYPYLPASRLERYATPSVKRDEKVRLRHIASEPIPTYAVVVPRLKYTRFNVSALHPATVASLDIDMIPVFETSGVIEAVNVQMSSGKAVPLMPGSFPVEWKSKDCLTFLYDLQPSSSLSHVAVPEPPTATPTNASVDTISIMILIKAKCSSNSMTTIRMSWNASVDFSTALNPSYGAPAQPLQRTNRPSSLNFAPYPDNSKPQKAPIKINTAVTSTRTASTNLQHQVIPTSIPRSESSAVVISFISGSKPSRVNVPFSWKVLIVNNSPKTVRLAIVPLPRIQRPTNTTQNFTKRHAPKASNSSITLVAKPVGRNAKGHTRNAPSTAKAVVDEQALYALHHQTASAAPNDTDLISLTAEIRIGPLGTGQCHETEIEFVAYKAGVFTLDAIRIVDLAKEAEGAVGMINDIRDLPDILVIDEAEGDFL